MTAGLYPAQPLSSLVQELNCPESAGRMAALMDQDQISFGPFRFDLGDSKLSFQGAPISLGSRALDILRVLALAKGNVVSRIDSLTRYGLAWPWRRTISRSTFPH